MATDEAHQSAVVAAAAEVGLRIGVMQGRLSPRPPAKLQEFPRGSYASEFPKAARLGFHSIEWIFEAPRFEENPLWTPAGRAEIRGLIAESGVAVQSVCADYFMVHRLAGEGAEAVGHSCEVLGQLIAAAH